MSELRKHKIESAILREVSTYMHSLDDPLLKSVTITHVEMSEDLRYAKVFYTIIGHENEEEEIKQKLIKATRRIQRDVAHRLKNMKFVPLLNFHFDLSIQKGNKVLEILDEVEKELKEKGEDVGGT
ncbi:MULTISPECIES: 30S ribosome-binding factor RbfA [Caldisericum]|jgi:ribosome-binding factor A|uniref:Ribosome-binding factor A n=1 Tax=Caldisericum exile TaxID=693075 RepID=A0A2J6WEX2_9BACT|nr:MAG: 30S ribosome-binding factor RbfA [Caldisericum exile]